MGLIKFIKKSSGMELVEDSPQIDDPSKKMDIKAAKIITSDFKQEDKFLMVIEQDLQKGIEKLQKAAEAIRVRRGFNSK